MPNDKADKCFLYILQSVNSGKYYVGISSDPVRRLEFHNTIETGYTSRYRPWKIVYTKCYSTRDEARKAEQKLKRWKSRAMIKKVINREVEI